MVIRLFDDPVVTCPECQGRGEVEVLRTARRDPSTGTWEVDAQTCLACADSPVAGSVPAAVAAVCTICDTTTVWRGTGCVLHDDVCPEHRPIGCGDCGQILREAS